MAYKTFSQKAARFFEIACYVLLIPAIISILFTLKEASFLVLIPLIITGIGVFLLIGYRKHARGTFDKDKLSLLWLGTLFFNGIPLTPIFYQFIFNPNKIQNFIFRITFEGALNPAVLLSFLLVLWWITAVSFSLTLLLDEFRRDMRIK